MNRGNAATSIEAEIRLWSAISPLSRQSNSIHAMTSLQIDYPRIYNLFRKHSVFLVFVKYGKPQTIEEKVVVGSAIQWHGFVFHYKNSTVSSSDEDE